MFSSYYGWNNFATDKNPADRVNLLSVGESQKIPCYELAQIVFS